MKHRIITIVVFGIFLVAPIQLLSQVVIKVVPQKPKAIVKPAKPAGNVVWIDGHWLWSKKKKDYVWVKGSWNKPKRGKAWVAGRWEKVPGGHKWIPGHWKRKAKAKRPAKRPVRGPRPARR
jgi:hypothetical protein